MGIFYGRNTVIEINLDNFVYNFNQFRKHIPSDINIMASLKANAYGHGVLPLAKQLISLGVKHLAVAFIDEGIELREGGIENDVDILIFGYTPPEAVEEAIMYNLSITVYRPEDLHLIQETARRLDRRALIHIKIDSGMSRLGLQLEELDLFFNTLLNMNFIKIEGIFTHFACADEKDQSYTQMQQDIFKEALNTAMKLGLEIPYIHSSNSAASIDINNIIGNMVRLGIGLYGLYPSKEVNHNAVNLRPILTFKSRISHIKQGEKNRGVGYGATYRATGKEWIATIPVGYADGLNRQLSNKGYALIKGKRVPIIGRICMDQLMLDVTKVMPVQMNEEVVFYGSQEEETIHIDEIAKSLNTINYEVTCMLSRRIPRLFRYKGKVTHVINELRRQTL